MTQFLSFLYQRLFILSWPFISLLIWYLALKRVDRIKYELEDHEHVELTDRSFLERVAVLLETLSWLRLVTVLFFFVSTYLLMMWYHSVDTGLRDPTDFPAHTIWGADGWLPQVALVIATVYCADLWTRLRKSGLQNAIVVAVAVWILIRCAWFTAATLSGGAISADYDAVLPILSGYSTFGIATTTATIAAVVSLILVSTQRWKRLQWGLLLFCVPFVAFSLMWNWAVSLGLFSLDPYFTMIVLGYFAAQENARIVSRPGSAWLLPDEPVKNLRYDLPLFVPLLIALFAVAILYHFSDPWLQSTSEPGLMLGKWLLIIGISDLAYIGFRRSHTRHQALKWTMLVWFIAFIAFSLPAVVADSMDSILHALSGIVFTQGFTWCIALVALLISLTFNRWRLAATCGIGAIWPLASFVAMVPVPDRLSDRIASITYTSWTDFALVIVVFFLWIYYVLGPADIRSDDPPPAPGEHTGRMTS